ncbi:hypothetical protein [Clostridioides difficile]
MWYVKKASVLTEVSAVVSFISTMWYVKVSLSTILILSVLVLYQLCGM